MLELPELDVYRALLSERFAGALITGIEVSNKINISASQERLEKYIIGKTVWFVERRANHLLFHLDNGKRLVVHLSLNAYLYSSLEDKVIADAAFTLRFEDRSLYFMGLLTDDVALLTVKEVEEKLRDYGPDPFDKRITLARFIERFSKKRGTIKSALMDSKVICGIGTVYSDEIAFTAGIRPDTKISTMDHDTWERLYVAMHRILQDAISIGGLSTYPLYEQDSFTGGYMEKLQVYNREDEACPSCGGQIERMLVSSRKTYYCPSCQK